MCRTRLAERTRHARRLSLCSSYALVLNVVRALSHQRVHCAVRRVRESEVRSGVTPVTSGPSMGTRAHS